jgi:hypothetical protein
MTDSSAKTTTSRRDFLKLAGTTAPAAALAAVTLGSGEAAATTAGATAEGLQDNAHTRAYYASARF